MTKAKTMHARRKFKNWWPCQKLRVSAGCTGTVVVAMAISLAWFHGSANSVSIAPATFRAIDPQISQLKLSCKCVVARHIVHSTAAATQPQIHEVDYPARVLGSLAPQNTKNVWLSAHAAVYGSIDLNQRLVFHFPSYSNIVFFSQKNLNP
ncbi:hypothetical protein OIU76_013305 [Salix suchowensis]|nr:hypothetical protein OIU76_013305 [Salix suchowensis]